MYQTTSRRPISGKMSPPGQAAVVSGGKHCTLFTFTFIKIIYSIFWWWLVVAVERILVYIINNIMILLFCYYRLAAADNDYNNIIVVRRLITTDKKTQACHRCYKSFKISMRHAGSKQAVHDISIYYKNKYYNIID